MGTASHEAILLFLELMNWLYDAKTLYNLGCNSPRVAYYARHPLCHMAQPLVGYSVRILLELCCSVVGRHDTRLAAHTVTRSPHWGKAVAALKNRASHNDVTTR